MALGGSTNTVLHLIAIANEAGVNLSLELFDKIAKSTPHITSLRPGGEYFIEDLEYAGGIPAVMKRLRQVLNSVQTVSGKTINQIAAEYGGGGHLSAAGATVNGKLDQVQTDVLEKVTALLEVDSTE